MSVGRIEGGFALLVVLCVLSIFFFPGAQGPYSVVHGPVTALLAARAAAGLRMAIAGVQLVRNYLSGARVALARSVWTAVPLAGFEVDSLPATCSAVLRC